MNKTNNTFNPLNVIRSILEQSMVQLEIPEDQSNLPIENPIEIGKLEDPIKGIIDHQIIVKNRKLETDSNGIISGLINKA